MEKSHGKLAAFSVKQVTKKGLLGPDEHRRYMELKVDAKRRCHLLTVLLVNYFMTLWGCGNALC
jgi:hypothetical protein